MLCPIWGSRHSARGGTAGHAEAAALTGRAATIFDHVAGRAWNATAAGCGGGIWWSTARSYKNAIANELFLTTAAQLGRTDPAYMVWAGRQWRWFNRSGMINKDFLVNDGLDRCRNNNRTTFTYNQGVLLLGLSRLHSAGGGAELLILATNIVDAVQ